MNRRLPPVDGEWIDREQPLRFRFEGEPVGAYAGDVISSALVASGRRTLARSFKYHRRRGVLSLANHDANVLLCHDGATQLRADVTAPQAGTDYRAVNTFGGLRHDAGRLLGLLAPVLPTGFYYKAFFRPRWLFPLWERVIRHAAGLGRLGDGARAERQPRRHVWCDVLVLGAGASGIAAAGRAADIGARVVLADEQARAGGRLNDAMAWETGARDWRDQQLAALAARDNVTVLSAHTAVGYYADHLVPLDGPDGLRLVHAGAVIVTTGVIAQPAVFPGNDLPGVMLLAAAARLARRYAVSPCSAGVVVAGTADAYDCALDLLDLGVPLVAVLDIGSDAGAGQERARAAGLQVVTGVTRLAAEARGGELAGVAFSAQDGRLAARIACDGLFVAVGNAPAASLLVQAGARLRYDEALAQHLPVDLPAGVFAAGSVNGMDSFASRVADGAAAAAQALGALGITGTTVAARPARPQARTSHPWPILATPRDKAFVDFDEDLTFGDLRTAVREGFDGIELMKRYSTIGMGPSQGKTSNMNGVRILAHLTDRDVGSVGVTTPRPFVQPVSMAKLAGRRHRRQWLTPLHAWHVAAGARMMESGAWLRPLHYAGDSADAATRAEYRAVRERVGLIDVSTLGKIELFGPDVDRLLDYAYPCRFDRLAVGVTRYVFMVDGGGTLVDDGVCARLAPDHCYLTTTTGFAAQALRELELFATQLDLDVAIIERTQDVGAINLAGPAAVSVLQQVCDLDLDETAFPYLAMREGHVAGVPARLMRIGFVGEAGYEIHLDADATPAVWDALMAAGAPAGIAPFGVAAQRLLRLEKGHFIVGQDTDGTTHPFELGLDRAVSPDKTRYRGRHALSALRGKATRALAGFVVEEPGGVHIAESHLVIDGDDIAGRITSVGSSPHCAAVIGLAMVDRRLAEPGTRWHIRVGDGSLVRARCTDLPFYDPGNTRQQLLHEPRTTQAAHTARADIRGHGAARPQPMPGADDADATALLVDVSAIGCRLVVGSDVPAWLAQHGIAAPADLLRTATLGADGLVARIHRNTWCVVAPAAPHPGDTLFELPAARHGEVLLLAHPRAQFALFGAAVTAVLDELCATAVAADDSAWYPLQLAGADVAVWRPAGGEPRLRILAAPADAASLRQVLTACVEEAGGRIGDLGAYVGRLGR